MPGEILCLNLPEHMKLFECYFGRYIRDIWRREHLDGNPVSIWSIRYDINLAPLLLRARRPLLSPKLYDQSSHFRDWLPRIFYHAITLRFNLNSYRFPAEALSLLGPAKIKKKIFAIQTIHLYSFIRFTVIFITRDNRKESCHWNIPVAAMNRGF